MTLGATGQRRRAAWVSSEEISRRLAAGVCRRCGAGGHFIRSCPFLPAQRPMSHVSTIQRPNDFPPPVLAPVPEAIAPTESEK